MSKTTVARRCGKTGKKSKSEPEAVTKHCLFCGTEEENEDLLGKMLNKGNIYVHYFCMLLSSGLCQRGQPDKDGLYGFLPKDIQAEAKRGKKLSCNFCKNKGATIGCSVKMCRASFHLTCGIASGSLHQFFGSYCSFCPTHRPRQASLTSDRLAFFGTANSTCAICICAVEARASNETLRSPCCRSSWFHRNCIQRLASTAGLHYFKCPLCNNKELFQEEMLEFGIYIPDQDAAWELDPNAYQELLERYNRCDAVKCHCPRGREHNQDLSKWEILLCVCCGSQGSHVHCGQLPSNEEDWMCPDCDRISKKSDPSGKKSARKSKRGKGSQNSSLKAQMKKEYEKLQEKARGGHSPSKAADSAEGSPGTSGLTKSPRCGPRVKNYPETIVRRTDKEEGEESNVDICGEDSEEEISLKKLSHRSKRRLRSRSSQSSCKEESDENDSNTNMCFPKGELTVSVSPCKVQPGTSVSVTTLNDRKKKKRKSRQSAWSKGNHFMTKKEPLSKKKRLQQKVESEESACSESVTDSFYTASVGSASSPVSFKLSPAIIERIRAPSPSFNITEPHEGNTEVKASGSLVSSTLSEDSQQSEPSNHKYKRNDKAGGGKDSWNPLDLSLLEVVTLSEGESDDELVSSTTKGDPSPTTYFDPLPVGQPFRISQPYTLSQQPYPTNLYPWPNLIPTMPVGEPEFIDLDSIPLNNTSEDKTSVPPAQSTNKLEKPERASPVPSTNNGGKDEEVLTISSQSSSDDDEVVFISAQNLHKRPQFCQRPVHPAGVIIPNTSYQSPHSIITPRGLRLLPARRPPNLMNTISTSSVMTSKGLRLIRPSVNMPRYPVYNINNPAVNPRMAQRMPRLHHFAQTMPMNRGIPPAFTKTISPSQIAGASGLSHTFLSPSGQARQLQCLSHPARNTRSQATGPVIDLTEEDRNISPPNISPPDIAPPNTSPPNTSPPELGSPEPTVSVSQFYNSDFFNSIPKATVSPLKINEITLQSIRSVVCNSTNSKPTPDEKTADLETADKSLIICDEPHQPAAIVNRKKSKLTLRKTPKDQQGETTCQMNANSQD